VEYAKDALEALQICKAFMERKGGNEREKHCLEIGGSTLKSKGDLEKIENILRLRQTPFVLVVSAVSGVTNMLKEALDNLATLDIKEFLENMERIYQAFLQNPSLELHQRVFAIRDFLLGAQLIGEAPPFVYDYVLSHGERCSSLLLTIHLNAAA